MAVPLAMFSTARELTPLSLCRAHEPWFQATIQEAYRASLKED
jgi:hypothetical protein